jgi:Phosphopantetheine attachment site
MREAIITEIKAIAQEHNKTLAPLTDDLVLLDSGLDSLCFAILVARLEDKFGSDPFSASDEAVFPVTLGDFIGLYQKVPA